MSKRNWKIAIFWFLGSLCMLFASMIAGNLGKGESSGISFTLAFLVSLFLYLVAGILWISVALAVKHMREEFLTI